MEAGLTVAMTSKRTQIQVEAVSSTSTSNPQERRWEATFSDHVPADMISFIERMQRKEEEEKEIHSTCFEIQPEMIQQLQRRCRELNYHILRHEYDFCRDTVNPDINMELKPTVVLQADQEESLRKMFGNGRARSGIIILPREKTALVGVAAACTVRKRCLVLVNNDEAAEDWKAKFQMWSTINDSEICTITSSTQDEFTNRPVAVVSFPMLHHPTLPSPRAEAVFNWMQNQQWGLLIMDEFHMFDELLCDFLTKVKANCKMGLSTTLRNNHENLEKYEGVVGPRLFEAK